MWAEAVKEEMEHSVKSCPRVTILVCNMRVVYYMAGPKNSDHKVTLILL